MGNEQVKKTSGKIFGFILYPDAKRGAFNSAEIIDDLWNFYSPTCDVAYALHDQDKKDDKDIKPHFHFYCRSRNTFTLSTLQQQWHISGHCSMILNKWEESVQYLCHQNPNYDGDDGGHVYDQKIIKCNFNLEKYFNNNKSSDPEYMQLLKILNWATHNKANYYQILKYAGEHGYFSVYRKSYRLIYDILGSKPWLTDSEVVDPDQDYGEEFIKF